MWAAAVLLVLFLTVDHSEEGRKALEAQDYAAAARHFAQAAAADPQDYAARFHLALSNSLIEKDEEAIQDYRKVLELKPGLYQAELNLGILLLRQKRAAEAVPLLRSAADARPGEFRPRYYLAEGLLAAGEPAKAAEHYTAALGIDPKSAAAELGMGRALARQDRLSEAVPHFVRAAGLDPGFEDALLELANLHEKAGQPAEAAAIYRRFPDNVAAQERLAELLLDSKQYAEAIPRLEEVYRKDPTPATRAALAAAYLFDKQPDKALPLLEESVGADGGNYDIRMMFARALRDAKQYAPAAQQFLEAARTRPDSREAWNDLAAMLYLTGNYPQSLAALERAHKLGDVSPANHYFRAITQDRMRDLPAALESYRKFLEASQGKNPDEEFKARQRVRIIEKELSKR
jgi:tetratricopeptide (TPR) repeat protein